MLGVTHAASGALAALLLAPLAARAGLDTGGAAGVSLLAVTAAGAAVLPDLDAPGGTAARALGPATGALARLLNRVSGGHRHMTHSVVGLAAGIAAGVAFGQIGGVPLGLFLGFAWAVGLTALDLKFFRGTVVNTALVIAGTVVFVGSSWAGLMPTALIGPAVGVGVAAHIVGDMLTREGVFVLSPFSRLRVSLSPMATGQKAERLLVLPAVVAALAMTVLWQTGAVAAVVGLVAPASAPDAPADRATGGDTFAVARIIDGDTFAVPGPDGGETVVRILGIDAPEAAACGGPEATQALAGLIPPGTAVRLTADPVSDQADRYGRLLRYADTAAGDAGLGLVQQGLAEAWWPSGEPRPTRAPAYQDAQQQAQAAQSGSWARCPAVGR